MVISSGKPQSNSGLSSDVIGEQRVLLHHDEHTKRLPEKFVDVLCEDLDLNVESAGALTSKKPLLKKGMEPDSAFYIQNEPLIRHKETIDFGRC